MMVIKFYYEVGTYKEKFEVFTFNRLEKEKKLSYMDKIRFFNDNISVFEGYIPNISAISLYSNELMDVPYIFSLQHIFKGINLIRTNYDVNDLFAGGNLPAQH